ncbi:MAG: hypothetical protein ABIP49_05530, partial [Lysobacterales bacterium]
DVGTGAGSATISGTGGTSSWISEVSLIALHPPCADWDCRLVPSDTAAALIVQGTDSFKAPTL